MSDQPKDGGQELANKGLPKPEFEEVSDDQQHSEAAKESVRFDENAFLAKVEDLIERKVQSSKDQRIDKLYKNLGSDPRQIVEAIKGGQDPDKVLESLERQSVFDRLERIETAVATPNRPSPNGRAEVDEAFNDAVGLVTEAGLANDPEIQEIFKGKYKTPGDFLFAVNRKVLARNTKPQPAAASVMSPAGGGATSNAKTAQANVDGLMEKLARTVSPEARTTVRAELAQARAELEKTEA